MSATRKGKRKRQNGDAELTQELAVLIYASESEDSEKGEWGGGQEWEVEKITGEAIDMCGRRESVIYPCPFWSATDTPIYRYRVSYLFAYHTLSLSLRRVGRMV